MRCALSSQGRSRGRVLDDGRDASHITGPSRSTEHDRSLCMADRPLRDPPRRAAPRQTISTTTAPTLRSISNAHATGTAGDGVAMGMPACGDGGNEDAAPLLAILNDRRPTISRAGRATGTVALRRTTTDHGQLTTDAPRKRRTFIFFIDEIIPLHSANDFVISSPLRDTARRKFQEQDDVNPLHSIHFRTSGYLWWRMPALAGL